MTSIVTNARERNRFIRFAVVGALGAGIDFGIMNLLTGLFHLALVPAGTISFIAAVVSNFTWNRFWTYPDSRTKPMWHQLTMFALVSVIGLGIRIPTLALVEPRLVALFQTLHVDLISRRIIFLAHNTTLAIAIIIVMLWNFFANRYWTYNDVSK